MPVTCHPRGKVHSVDVSLTMCNGRPVRKGLGSPTWRQKKTQTGPRFQASSCLWPDEDDPTWVIRLLWHRVDGRYEVNGFEMNATRDNRTP